MIFTLLGSAVKYFYFIPIYTVSQSQGHGVKPTGQCKSLQDTETQAKQVHKTPCCQSQIRAPNFLFGGEVGMGGGSKVSFQPRVKSGFNLINARVTQLQDSFVFSFQAQSLMFLGFPPLLFVISLRISQNIFWSYSTLLHPPQMHPLSLPTQFYVFFSPIATKYSLYS